MATKPILPASMMRQLFTYDPETGNMFHKERNMALFSREQDMLRWNTCFAGQRADCSATNGYKIVSVQNRRYPAHRVAWAIVHGDWPADVIDHINGNPSDNRITNLRSVTRALNQRNMAVRSTSSGKAVGVYWDRGKFVAKIGSKATSRHLGRFATRQEAIAARRKAEDELGYHANHGRLGHVA